MNEETNSARSNDSKRPLPVWRALLAGWLLVNIPVLIIMLGILLVGATIEPRIWWLFLAIGFFLGWTWWSFTIARWRKWALNRGAPPDRLQKWAVAVGLTWPKGWVFEKTEVRNDD
jgi:hypothetical protein